MFSHPLLFGTADEPGVDQKLEPAIETVESLYQGFLRVEVVHDAAREGIRGAVIGVGGVLDDPAPEVLLTELGESSVDFEVRYWTLPDIRSVRHTQDAVLSAAKRAIEEAGMTIPWPIRTLVVDGPVAVDRGVES